MEETVGRVRQGRVTRGHSSARREAGAAAVGRRKRGRNRQPTPPPMVQESHDNEAGSSAASGSQRGSRGAQVQEAGPEVAEEGQHVVVEAVQQQEGYGGGPTDMSLLHAYHKHRAIPIWDALNPEDAVVKHTMRSVPNGRKVINLPKFPRHVEWFWDAIHATGLEPLTRTNYGIIDHGLMTAFADRWHPETHTFHLPIGEVGITLDDVQCLLHLPITGPFLNHEKMQKYVAVDLVHRNLGIDETAVWKMFEKTGAHIKYKDLKNVYEKSKEAIEKA
ncbi:putative IMP dehydrogenase/GMP reductase, partial [Trifolium medium]|nr:putative IMP dehydrogenase/GMP reductase [Trifolium medium]